MFNFAADDKLPAALAARMQKVADTRAAAGLADNHGTLHKNAEKRDYMNKLYIHKSHGIYTREELEAEKADLKARKLW